MTEVTLLYFDGCPNWQSANEHLEQLRAEVTFNLRRREVVSHEDADGLGFSGSPTILVDGIDPFATGGEPTGLTCRVYATPDGPQGSPTIEQLRTALQRS